MENKSHSNFKVIDSNSKLIKYYQLNDEGLRKYGIAKKQQLFKTLKWSTFGTVIGYASNFLIEYMFKKMDSSRKDIFKAGFLCLCVGFFSFQGYKISMFQFIKQQNEICEQFGKEIEEKDGQYIY